RRACSAQRPDASARAPAERADLALRPRRTLVRPAGPRRPHPCGVLGVASAEVTAQRGWIVNDRLAALHADHALVLEPMHDPGGLLAGGASQAGDVHRRTDDLDVPVAPALGLPRLDLTEQRRRDPSRDGG